MAETFDADWLALREPADHTARAHQLLRPLQERWRAQGWSRVLDLGSGTGSNLRYLAPHLPSPQQWTLFDHDAELLSVAARRCAPTLEPPNELRTVQGDLAREALPLVRDADLVTASALLDLVPAAWVTRLARACRAAETGVLLALTYDGNVQWAGEAHPGDDLVLAAVNRHQLGDKGMGRALGPNAAAAAEEAFGQSGFAVQIRPSSWLLGPDEAPLVEALVDGWMRAALEQRDGTQDTIRAWAQDRRTQIANERFQLSVGHVDLLALPQR